MVLVPPDPRARRPAARDHVGTASPGADPIAPRAAPIAVDQPVERPAFYALAPGGWRDYATLLHLPYTAWHLSYVAIGAALSGTLDGARLLATLAAFMLAVGVAAHCLDEFHGRPLGTRVPSRVLIALSVLSLVGAGIIGVVGASDVGWSLIPWVVVGVVLVPAYDLEWGGRVVHNDIGFALGWGAFPVLVGAAAQGGVNLAVVLAAGFAIVTSLAQRRLSTSVRTLRRRAATVEGEITWRDGTRTRLDSAALTRPAEAALLLLAGAHILLAVALVVAAV
jgi:hypothetical protein